MQTPVPTRSSVPSLVRWTEKEGTDWAPSSTPPECGSLEEMFGVFPIDSNVLTQFARPGRTGMNGTIYIAHGALRADNTTYDQIEVRFPAGGFSLYSANRRLEDYINDGEEQVKLEFHHPCGIQVRIDHLAKVTDRWAAIIKDVPIRTDSRITFMPPGQYSVEAGEILAHAVGHATNTYLDFGVYDLRNKNDSAEMIARDWPEYRGSGDYAICWSGFFGPQIRKLLEGLPAGVVATSDYCD
jgi:hypothetical protein